MTTKNKHFLKKKLPTYIKFASSLSLAVGVAGAVAPVFAQGTADSQVEEVLVSGQRASIQSAQDIKKNSSVVVDSIVAEDIGKLPDRSVTEALQRVPGVTVGRYTNNDAEHPAAEGSGVAVRGLSQVRSELNGRDVFSAAGGRGLSFEDVPAELMYAVDTYKSPSADMIEGGLGGTVNLRTRMPFDSDGQLVSLSVKGNYGDQIKESNGEYSGLYSNRWDTSVGEFGVLVNASTSDLSSRSDQVYTRAFLPRTINGDDVWVSKGVDWRRNDYESTREGGYLALQWAPNDATELYFTAFQSKHDTTYDENAFFLEGANGDQALFPTADDDWVYDANGALQSGTVTVSNPTQWGLDFGTSTRWANNVSETTDYSSGIKWSPDDHWKFSADFQYVKAEATSDDFTLGLKVIPEAAYMDGIGTKTPSVLLDPEYMADFSNYSLGQEMTHFERNDAEAKTARFDAEYSFDDSVIKSVKAGVRYSDKSADNINTEYDWNTRYATWYTKLDWSNYDKNTLPKVTADEASKYLNLYSFDDFQRGDVAVPAAGYLYSADAVKSFAATTAAINGDRATTCAIYQPWICDSIYPDTNRLTSPEYRNQQSETNFAAYLMANFGFEDLAMPVDGNIGVRVIEVDNQADGYEGWNNLDAPPGVGFAKDSSPYRVQHSRSYVLPSLNLRVKATDDIFIRFAASQSIWSPSFSELQAKRIITNSKKDGVNNVATTDDVKFAQDQFSNPDLKPMEATQFDISAEWYFDDNGGMAHAAVFRKEIDDLFRRENVVYDLSNPNGVVVPVNTTVLKNVGSGEITGAEIGVSKFFDSLPAPFDGLGIQASYTYIDSKAKNPANPDGVTPVDTDRSRYGQMPLEQLSENAYNIVGMYERDGFSARLAYTWRSEYLITWGGNGFDPDFNFGTSGKARLPVYNDDYGQLDASVSYTFLDNYTVTAEATNLLKEKTVGIIDQNGAGDHVAYSYAQDARFAIGLRAKF
ncbi:MAG TPA: TonB-dependent receptor [Cellvibrio sp.]|nr:TonB-dependent receptor [Cellvibrio sp.]